MSMILFKLYFSVETLLKLWVIIRNVSELTKVVLANIVKYTLYLFF